MSRLGQKQSNGETPAVESSSDQRDGNNPSPKHYIYYKVPILMVASLLIGTLLAIGQHLFFKSLDGHPVPSQARQSWNHSFGLAFTFLVKTFLNTAISIACVQNIWWLLRSRSAPLETIDSVYGVLGSALKVTEFRVWLFAPSVAILACGVWIILPLAAISPSSTLTVQLTTTNATQLMKVPNIDYTINSFALGGGLPFGLYTGPTSDVSRLVDNVVSQGSILNLTENALCSNCAYSLDFFGPSVRCNQVPTNTTAFLTKEINILISSANQHGNQINGLDSSPLYTAFVPDTPDFDTNLTAEFANMLGGLTKLYNDTYPLESFVDEASPDHQRLFIYYINGNASAIECELYNASYQVDFELKNGAQSVNLRNVTYLNGVTYVENSPSLLLSCYQKQEFCGSQITTSIPTASFTTSVLNNAAYQAVMNALNKFFVGHIENEAAQIGTLVSNTRILSSFLSATPELQHVTSLFSDSILTINTSLSQAIEELSQSITISLFSSPKFLQGAKSQTSQDAPNIITNATDTEVTTFDQVNIYVYTPRLLYISWGIAILYALFAVAVGFLSLIKNGYSYSNNFSTVLRTTRHVELDTILVPTAKTGADPLPKPLAKRTITIKSHMGVDSDSFESGNSH